MPNESEKEWWDNGIFKGDAYDEVKDIVQEAQRRALEGNETEVKYYCKDERYCNWYECISCGGSMITASSNFCPNCGKKLSDPLKKLRSLNQ